MTSKKRFWVQILVLALLMGATLVFIFRKCDVRVILSTIHSAKLLPLGAAVVAMLLYVFCGGHCVRILFEAMGDRMSVWKCIKYSFTEFFFSAITPSSTGGQPMEAMAMREDGYSLTGSTAVLLAVAALYKFSLLGLFFLLYACNFSFLHAQVMGMRGLFFLGLAMNVLLIAGICVALYARRLVSRLCAWGLRILVKLRIVKHPERAADRLNVHLGNYHECATFMRTHPWAVLRAFLTVTLQRIMLLLVPYLVYISLGLSGVTIWQIMGLQLLLSVSVDMLPLPGAMGISESVFLVLYDAIFGGRFLYSAVLMCRGISFYLLLPLSGIVVFAVYCRGMRRRRELT